MSQYQELDNAILNALSHTSQPMKFVRLECHPDIRQAAARLGELTGRPDWRIIDGRLIALRKLSIIAPAPKRAGWELLS